MISDLVSIIHYGFEEFDVVMAEVERWSPSSPSTSGSRLPSGAS